MLVLFISDSFYDLREARGHLYKNLGKEVTQAEDGHQGKIPTEVRPGRYWAGNQNMERVLL